MIESLNKLTDLPSFKMHTRLSAKRTEDKAKPVENLKSGEFIDFTLPKTNPPVVVSSMLKPPTVNEIHPPVVWCQSKVEKML
jgi:hypothetical protein